MSATINTQALAQGVQISDVATAVRAAFEAAQAGKRAKESVWATIRAFGLANPEQAAKDSLIATLKAMKDVPRGTWSDYVELAYRADCRADSSVASLREARKAEKLPDASKPGAVEPAPAASVAFSDGLMDALMAHAVEGIVTFDSVIAAARAEVMRRADAAKAEEHAAKQAAADAVAKARAAKAAAKADPLAA